MRTTFFFSELVAKGLDFAWPYASTFSVTSRKQWVAGVGGSEEAALALRLDNSVSVGNVSAVIVFNTCLHSLITILP